MYQHLLGHLVNLLLSSPASKGEVSSTCNAMLILMEDPVMLVSVMVFAYRIAILSPLMVSGKTSGKEHLLWGIDQIASLPPPRFSGLSFPHSVLADGRGFV